MIAWSVGHNGASNMRVCSDILGGGDSYELYSDVNSFKTNYYFIFKTNEKH